MLTRSSTIRRGGYTQGMGPRYDAERTVIPGVHSVAGLRMVILTSLTVAPRGAQNPSRVHIPCELAAPRDLPLWQRLEVRVKVRVPPGGTTHGVALPRGS